MKKFIAIAGLSLLASLPSSARAQDPLAALETAVGGTYARMFGVVIPTLLEASAKLDEARGNKLAAEEKRALAENARKGASKPDKNFAEKVITQTSLASDSMAAGFAAQGAALSKEQTSAFIDGAVMYFQGTKATVELSTSLAELGQAITGAASIRNPFELRKVAGLLLVGKLLTTGIPQVLKSNVQAATALKTFVTANKIPIPTDKMSWK